MFFMLTMTIILSFIPMIFLMMNLILSKKSNNKREKKSPFECGFDPISNSRIPFSIHFFLISLIFLIFDIEITLLIPMIIMFKKFNMIMILSTSFFLIILIFGLYLEYSEQSIDWKI